MTPRVLSYARVSSLQQTHGYSLESQKDRAADYARFKGWPEPIHFSDGGVSGTRTQRPGLQALQATIQPGDVILVKDITRLGRGGAVQTLGIIHDLESRGASITFIDQNIDTSTPTGRLILTMMAGFSELELEQTRERSLLGRRQAARTGHWPLNSVPFGYRRGSDRKLELDPLTAPHARAALDALTGRSLREALKILQDAGTPATPSGKGRWTISKLHDMLHTTAYMGQAQLKVGTEHYTVPCPPLVTPEQWAQMHARPEKEGGAPKPATYPLTGHLRCPHGAPYTGNTQRGRGAGGQDWRHYKISNQARARYGCRCRDGRGDDLETEARELLAQFLERPNDPAHLRVLWRPEPSTPDPTAQQLQEIKTQLSRLTDLQVRGLLELDDYLRLRGELKAQEAKLTPPPEPDAAPLPAQTKAAALIRISSREHLAEALDAFGARFTLTDGKTLELTEIARLI